MQPLFNQPDQEWVLQVGRYIMYMGALEHVTSEIRSCLLKDSTGRSPLASQLRQHSKHLKPAVHGALQSTHPFRDYQRKHEAACGCGVL